jgi:hypothetical protein
MMLFAAIAVLTLTVAIGGWLGALYLMLDRPPATLRWPGILHGASGLAGFALLVAALRGPLPTAHAARMGAGSFGGFAGALIAGAVLAGLTLLLARLRRRPIATALVATHGMLGIVGYVLLLTFVTMLH